MEKPLKGGHMTPVSRVGGEVRRESGPWSSTVQTLLTHLKDNGVDWCPEPLGWDEGGREALTYLKGKVPTYPLPDWVYDESVLTTAATWMRQLHDLTVDFDRPGMRWRSPRQQPAEVICHNDFAPYNMVFKNHEPVGLIDWDFAGPGPRVWDLAYLAYRLAPLMRPSNPDAPDLSLKLERRIGLLLEAYGTDVGISVPQLLLTVIDRLDDLADMTKGHAKATKNDALAKDAHNYSRDAEYLKSLLK